MKGTNAFIYALPFAALYYEALATSDALSYLEDQECTKEREDAYKILYPAFSTYVGGNLANIVVGPALQYAGVIPGHIAGQVAATKVQEMGPCGLYPAPEMSPVFAQPEDPATIP